METQLSILYFRKEALAFLREVLDDTEERFNRFAPKTAVAS